MHRRACEGVVGHQDVDRRREDDGEHGRCEIDMAIGNHGANSKNRSHGGAVGVRRDAT